MEGLKRGGKVSIKKKRVVRKRTTKTVTQVAKGKKIAQFKGTGAQVIVNIPNPKNQARQLLNESQARGLSSILPSVMAAQIQSQTRMEQLMDSRLRNEQHIGHAEAVRASAVAAGSNLAAEDAGIRLSGLAAENRRVAAQQRRIQEQVAELPMVEETRQLMGAPKPLHLAGGAPPPKRHAEATSAFRKSAEEFSTRRSEEGGPVAAPAETSPSGVIAAFRGMGTPAQFHSPEEHGQRRPPVSGVPMRPSGRLLGPADISVPRSALIHTTSVGKTDPKGVRTEKYGTSVSAKVKMVPRPPKAVAQGVTPYHATSIVSTDPERESSGGAFLPRKWPGHTTPSSLGSEREKTEWRKIGKQKPSTLEANLERERARLEAKQTQKPSSSGRREQHARAVATIKRKIDVLERKIKKK